MDPTADMPATPAESGELLSAYLAGELSEGEVAALEARLAEDADLRAELERQRKVQEVLAGLAAPTAAAGADVRLRERLARERAAPADEAPDAEAPASLDAARARRRPGGISWAAVGGVAAALVALLVVGAGSLGGFGQQDTVAAPDSAREFFDAEEEAGDAGLESMDAPEEGDAMRAPEEDDAAATVEEEAAELESGPAAATGAAPPVEPVIAEEGTVLAGEQEVRDHLSGRPEATGLLGLSGEDAREVAAAFTVAIRGAEPFSDGTRPDACLESITDGAGDTAVPARVELVLHEGIPALAHLVVAAADGQTLDRVEAWIVEPTTCATRLYLVLDS